MVEMLREVIYYGNQYIQGMMLSMQRTQQIIPHGRHGKNKFNTTWKHVVWTAPISTIHQYLLTLLAYLSWARLALSVPLEDFPCLLRRLMCCQASWLVLSSKTSRKPFRSCQVPLHLGLLLLDACTHVLKEEQHLHLLSFHVIVLLCRNCKYLFDALLGFTDQNLSLEPESRLSPRYSLPRTCFLLLRLTC